jgi:hypothetical protein
MSLTQKQLQQIAKFKRDYLGKMWDSFQICKKLHSKKSNEAAAEAVFMAIFSAFIQPMIKRKPAHAFQPLAKDMGLNISSEEFNNVLDSLVVTLQGSLEEKISQVFKDSSPVKDGEQAVPQPLSSQKKNFASEEASSVKTKRVKRKVVKDGNDGLPPLAALTADDQVFTLKEQAAASLETLSQATPSAPLQDCSMLSVAPSCPPVGNLLAQSLPLMPYPFLSPYMLPPFMPALPASSAGIGASAQATPMFQMQLQANSNAGNLLNLENAEETHAEL